MEVWKKIEDYPRYEVSSLGKVRRSGKILKPFNNPAGYLYLSLFHNGLSKRVAVHRLVATCFIPNPDNKPMVNHLDGVKSNNKLENLEWVTCKENSHHAHNVLGTPNPPAWAKGKFGKDHNKSIGFDLMDNNGIITHYESGYEFKRMTGMDNSCITWGRKNGLPYSFKKGPLKGYKLIK